MASPLLAPALAETALIIYRDVRNGKADSYPIKYLPLPSQLVSVTVVFGGLSLLPDRASRLATIAGWGFVVATAIQMYSSNRKSANG